MYENEDEAYWAGFEEGYQKGIEEKEDEIAILKNKLEHIYDTVYEFIDDVKGLVKFDKPFD